MESAQDPSSQCPQEARCSASSHNLNTHLTVWDPGSCFRSLPPPALPRCSQLFPRLEGGAQDPVLWRRQTWLAPLQKVSPLPACSLPVCFSPSATQAPSRVDDGFSQCGVHTPSPAPPSWLLPRAREARGQKKTSNPQPQPCCPATSWHSGYSSILS